MEGKLEMIEKYNEKGVCIERSINGYKLEPDTEPSIQIFKNISSIEQHFFLTPEQARQTYNYKLNNKRI